MGRGGEGTDEGERGRGDEGTRGRGGEGAGGSICPIIPHIILLPLSQYDINLVPSPIPFKHTTYIHTYMYDPSFRLHRDEVGSQPC